MRRALVLSAFLLVFIGVATAAEANVVRYMSKHPLPRKVGRGFCYIDVPHFHDYPPSDPRLYRQADGQNYFVGDPAPFDYDGQRYTYYGAHPVVDPNVELGGPAYCYLRGPHTHWYAPPPQAPFELKGGAYWYVGAYDPVYYDQRPRYVVVNDAYAPLVYVRPVVDVTIAPPAFRGEIVMGGGGWRGQAVVGGPRAEVYVAAPPPVVQVGVGLNLGGPPPVIEQREVFVRERDRGNHRGWSNRGHDAHGWRGGPPSAPVAHGGGWRGGPQSPAVQGGGWRGGPQSPAAAHGAGWRGNQPAAVAAGPTRGSGWRGGAAQPAHHNSGGWRR